MPIDEETIETPAEDLDQEGLEKGGETDLGDELPENPETPTPEPDDEEDEVTVSIGDSDPQAEQERQAPQWVRDLRKADREKTRRIKDLEAQLASQRTEAKPVQLGPKPTLEDFDYDAEKFEKALTTWFEDKRKADQEEQRKRDEAKAQDDAWQARLQTYEKQKAETKIKDFDQAELEVRNTLSVVQQGIIVQGADNAALVVAAIGQNPAKAKELSAITDPVKFAFTIAKLEAQLKVTSRKTPKPEPERMPSGTSHVAGGAVDSTLEKLREEAQRTGDYTKYFAHKNRKSK